MVVIYYYMNTSCHIIFVCPLGADIVAALENGVTDVPHDEGKFLQVSGITYGFDPEQPPGSRVDPRLVKVKEEYIQLDKVCSLRKPP